MMQKKMINPFLILLFIVNLISCSSLPSLKQNADNSVANANDIFVDASIAHAMGMADRVKLQDLVATAQPQQWVKWYSTTGARFEFRSIRIYVNAQGQGCRDYQIARNRGFLAHRSFSYTACRDNQGVWKITSQ
jgi:surface antigen